MIKKQYQIKAPLEEVWDALTDRNMILEWSGFPAEMNASAGSNFSLWEGDIHGTNIEVVPQQKLVQNWYGGDWDVPSLVTFTLSFNNGVTSVDLEHTGIPPYEKADFATGWDDYYMDPIKQLLESPPPTSTPAEGQINVEDVYDDSILDEFRASENSETNTQPPQDSLSDPSNDQAPPPQSPQ